jgi:hypothetical protein
VNLSHEKGRKAGNGGKGRKGTSAGTQECRNAGMQECRNAEENKAQ